ncbi:hypothetical protein WJR50_03390 [Catalinimonas sp. 4WD22]|uniref:hypothetical protein n=1 Tax=Catalinimonas locisalis TaxID=3133978 RepID=UPI003100BFFA
MKTFILLIPLAIISNGCEEKFCEPEIFDFTQARVTWSGDPRIDLCGFAVGIDGIGYKPINPDIFGPEFKISRDTIVELSYKDLKKEVYACGYSPSKARAIEILEIR